MNIIIAADQGQGKTTLCLKLSTMLRLKGKVKGFLCPKDKILDLDSLKEESFLSTTPVKASIKVGKHYVRKKGIDFGYRSLKNLKKSDFVFIDQYWKLELQKKGFYRAIKESLEKANLIIIVRKIALDRFLQHFPDSEFKIFSLTKKNRNVLVKIFFLT